MTKTSLTGTESFAARILQSERWRVRLLALTLAVILLTTLFRRAMGGMVMSVDALFHTASIILVVGIGYQVVVLLLVRRQARLGGPLPRRHWIISLAMDLAIPTALVVCSQRFSPRGAEAALSAPGLLLFPLIVLLSILRLKPWFSLWTGVCAAVIHAGLVVHAATIDSVMPDHYPVLFSYSVMILITGLSGAVVSLMARRYVVEAVNEATAAELAHRGMAVIEQDLTVARDIQRGLLPAEHPAIDGYDIAGMARPAAHAGGDYYDWQPLPDGRLLVALADVTGHGIGPALVMAVCRAYARAAAPTCDGPDTLLTRLNDLIYDDVKGARFITMAIALLGPNGNVEMVSAGHGPTLLYRAATGDVEVFHADGLPLGITPGETYGPHQKLRLEPGDVVVLATDGFLEHHRTDSTEQYGTRRLVESLKACAKGSSEEIVVAIDKAVGVYAAGAPQADDMTAVAIKRV